MDRIWTPNTINLQAERDEMSKLRLISIEMELQAVTTPKLYPFIALVTYGGRASSHPVGGTEQLKDGPYRVIIPPTLLEAKIRKLEGKKVFAASDLTSHLHAIEVGEFVSAWVEPIKDSTGEIVLAARASGFLNENKDPELVQRAIAEARNGQMGFSYDIKAVQFKVIAAVSSGAVSEEMIELADFEWRGATILRRDAAAYEFTQLAAHKLRKDTEVDKNEIIKAVTDSVGPLLEKFSTDVFVPFKLQVEASVSGFKSSLEEVKTKQTSLEASVAALPKGEQKKEEKKEEEKPAGMKLSMADFTASIGQSIKNALVEANKPVLDALEKISAGKTKQEEDESSFRKSLDGLTLEALAKYNVTDDDEPSVEKYVQLIASVNNDDKISRPEKVKLLGVLGAAKRSLIRQSLRGGGAN